jgi:hypothetical protein
MYIGKNTADQMTLLDIERFVNKFTIVSGGCWSWKKPNENGYGRFYLHGRDQPAHRLSYQLVNGNINIHLPIDHLCRNRDCVNPNHLEQVSFRENMVRSPNHIGNDNRAKTHCKRGHEYNVRNTYITPKGFRDCRVCRTTMMRDYLPKWRAKRA